MNTNTTTMNTRDEAKTDSFSQNESEVGKEMNPTTSKMNANNWNWVSTRTTATTIVLTYPEGKAIEEVHERTEVDYPERTWDWTVDEGKREVSVFRNHWRVKEEADLKKGKTQGQIWEEEAIGKALRMKQIEKKLGFVCVGKDALEVLKECWTANKMRGGCVEFGGRPPMTEEEARAEVEKAFADYIAEYGEEGEARDEEEEEEEDSDDE